MVWKGKDKISLQENLNAFFHHSTYCCLAVLILSSGTMFHANYSPKFPLGSWFWNNWIIFVYVNWLTFVFTCQVCPVSYFNCKVMEFSTSRKLNVSGITYDDLWQPSVSEWVINSGCMKLAPHVEEMCLCFWATHMSVCVTASFQPQGIGEPSVYHAVVVIFLEFFAWGLLTTPMLTVSK